MKHPAQDADGIGVQGSRTCVRDGKRVFVTRRSGGGHAGSITETCVTVSSSLSSAQASGAIGCTGIPNRRSGGRGRASPSVSPCGWSSGDSAHARLTSVRAFAINADISAVPVEGCPTTVVAMQPSVHHNSARNDEPDVPGLGGADDLIGEGDRHGRRAARASREALARAVDRRQRGRTRDVADDARSLPATWSTTRPMAFEAWSC